jgi:dTDP-4-amino-4,6-dideoxygalactose transaminase
MLARVRTNLALGDLWCAASAEIADPILAFESAFSSRFGFPYALLFPYGRSALHALLAALRWQEREILCPAYICAEVPYAISLSGNYVRFVDSAADHFLPGHKEWATATTSQSAMAIITPLFGYPIDEKCQGTVRSASPNAFILYDESQSYGITDADGFQARDADAVLFSLGLGKMLTALSGGVLLLRDSAVYRAVRHFRDVHCTRPTPVDTLKRLVRALAAWIAFREPALTLTDFIARRFGVFAIEAQDWVPSEKSIVPYDGRILPSAFQSQIGLRQFARLDAFLGERRHIGSYYDRRLHEEGFHQFAHACLPTWPRYPFGVADRDETARRLHKQGIQVSFFLPYSCASLPPYRSHSVACPNANLWGRSMINLPNWHGLKVAQAERVVRALLRIRDQEPRTVAWPSRAA